MSTAGELSGAPLPRIYKEGDLDFFIEPRWTVDALLEEENFEDGVWDPACGSGTIPDAMHDTGLLVHRSDIADRGQGLVYDFVDGDPWLPGIVSAIVTNPPYGLAERFAYAALAIAPKVALLVQSKFPYSQRRYRLFTDHPPAKIYFLSNRPSMPPGEAFLRGEIKAAGGKLDYCWIVWERGRTPEAPGWLRKAMP